MTSAQAWHRIDPASGAAGAAPLLRSGECLALVRNSYRYEDAVNEVVTDVFGADTPDLLTQSVPLGAVEPDYSA